MEKAAVFILLSIIAVVSGCTSLTGPGGKTFSYSNNIVTIESKSISTLDPYPGSSVSISFWVKNNGDKPVDIIVDFFNVPSSLNPELSCEAKKQTGALKCSFDKVEPFDTRPVQLDMKMPRENIQSPIAYTIAYSISYDWEGFRSASIPIIDSLTREKPASKFSQSGLTYGPISVDAQPPVGRTYKEGAKTIKEHWGTLDRPFEIKMSFKHIGSPQGDLDDPFTIPENGISISTNSMDVAEGVFCAFKKRGSPSESCDSNDMKTGNCVYPKKLELAGDVVCNFQSTESTSVGEALGVLDISYNYTYRFSNADVIIEQPAPQ